MASSSPPSASPSSASSSSSGGGVHGASAGASASAGTAVPSMSAEAGTQPTLLGRAPAPRSREEALRQARYERWSESR